MFVYYTPYLYYRNQTYHILRLEQNYNSDVDILVELADDTNIDKYRSDIISLKGKVSPLDLALPIVDMHVVVGSKWMSSNLLYYQNVKRDGVDVWKIQE